MQNNIVIKETTDYYPLSVLFHDNGVGVPVRKDTPEGMVKMWKMENTENGELIAAVTLQIRAGVYALGSIAVDPKYRNMGYGMMMQETIIAEAKKLGLKELWACAKVPDYYFKTGWEKMPWETSPKVDVNCPTCDKLGKTCNPSIIRKVID